MKMTGRVIEGINSLSQHPEKQQEISFFNVSPLFYCHLQLREGKNKTTEERKRAMLKWLAATTDGEDVLLCIGFRLYLQPNEDDQSNGCFWSKQAGFFLLTNGCDKM